MTSRPETPQSLLNLSLQERLTEVRARIAAACAACGRDPGSVQLLAVSKGHGAALIREAYHLGMRDFGENYIQEWQTKQASLADLPDLHWHLIGHLQSNKAKIAAVGLECLQSIDRVGIGEVLERVRTLQNASISPLKILLQLEMASDDHNKHGAKPKEWEDLCRFVSGLRQLQWVGFMGIAPANRPPEELINIYARFAEATQALWKRHSQQPDTAPIVSLGMSTDLEMAIASGSTQVRIGTSLFGERNGAF